MKKPSRGRRRKSRGKKTNNPLLTLDLFSFVKVGALSLSSFFALRLGLLLIWSCGAPSRARLRARETERSTAKRERQRTWSSKTVAAAVTADDDWALSLFGQSRAHEEPRQPTLELQSSALPSPAPLSELEAQGSRSRCAEGRSLLWLFSALNARCRRRSPPLPSAALSLEC